MWGHKSPRTCNQIGTLHLEVNALNNTYMNNDQMLFTSGGSLGTCLKVSIQFLLQRFGLFFFLNFKLGFLLKIHLSFCFFAHWSKALQSHITVSVEIVEQRDRDKFLNIVSLPLFTSKCVGSETLFKFFVYVETNISGFGVF